MRIITIARKPLSEKTVASNVLKHGCGGLNIDECRVGNEKRLNAQKGGDSLNVLVRPHGNDSKESKAMGAYGVGAHQFTTGYKKVEGRWPANLILIHKAGCERVGTKSVRGQGGNGLTKTPARSWKNQSKAGINRVGHADEDGKETVEDWNCEEGCPVRELGEQGGILKSGLLKSKHKGFGNHGIYGKAEVEVYHPTYGDIGSAARFFKQIKDS